MILFVFNVRNRFSNAAGTGYDKVSGYVNINKIKLPLSGTVNVSGTGEYNTTLTASFTGNNVSSPPQYCWYVDGEETTYTTSTFTVYADHIGKQITVRVTDSKRDGSIESTPILGIKGTGHYAAPVVSVNKKPSVPGAVTTVTMPDADTLIPFASCTIAMPVDGGTPVTAVTVPAGANYTVTVDSCKKTSDGSSAATFEAPNNYQYELKFTAKPGYKFQYSGGNKTALKINGATVSAVGGDMANGSYLTVRVTYQCAHAPLVGTLEIDGDPLCGNTVTASLAGDNASGTLTCTWYLDGTQMKIGESFDIDQEGYVGKELTVELTDSKHSGKLVSPGVTVYKVGMIKLPKPTTYFVPNGPDSGTLCGFTIGSHAYKIDSGEWTNVATGLSSVDLTELSACTISVKCVGNGTTTVDSDSQTISVGKAATPTLTAVQPASVGGKGSIPGVTAAMEYKKGESGIWTDCPDGTLADLAPDTYCVRIKASGTTLASEAQTITIEEFFITFTAIRSEKTVTVSVDDLPEACLLIVAGYSGGQMTGVWTQSCAANTALSPAFTVSSSTTDVKCFLVSTANYAPLTGAIIPTSAV